ncbi:uncharacterized protein LOC135954892 [Calliphora vicina]|uniref:uncharacterized protein LOC135954892 n=1 Tax=Calliphora vicina TaxID=7373 RepID=UPI00325B7C05
MKSLELSAFEKVSQNLDVAQYLFKFLEIPDQLRFANVSPQLMFVFRHFIWDESNYTKLQIMKYLHIIRVENYNDNRMDLDLYLEEYEYFLNIFGFDVLELKESHGSALNISHTLKNLTTIKYNYLLICKDQLQLLAQMCTQLETLFIYGCCNKKHKIIRLGLDIEVTHLLAMKRLKTFSLKTGLDYKIKYGFVEDFMKKSKPPLYLSSLIETLDIYMPKLNVRFLEIFTHLKSLTITVFNPVTRQEILDMGECCPELKQLTLHYVSFEDADNFSALRNLSDLSFYNCEGLTYDNLKEILTKIQLVTFTSIGTKYEGIFHYYFIAPTIKSIYIDAIKSFDFKSEMEFYRFLRRSVE